MESIGLTKYLPHQLDLTLKSEYLYFDLSIHQIIFLSYIHSLHQILLILSSNFFLIMHCDSVYMDI